MEDSTLRDSFGGLTALIAVARAKSFTRAAVQLGVSQSAVSHAVRALEERLGARLLARNSRTVTPTEVGERLLHIVAPRLKEIDAEMSALSDLGGSPRGSIRVTAPDYPSRTILAPKLKEFLPKYPDIKVELSIDNRFVDLVAEQFDAGVRLGEAIAQDMIAVQIGPDVRFTVVGTKRYFATHAVPRTPGDLVHHSCVNLRLMAHGGLWAWEFEKGGRPVNVRVDGQLACNDIYECLAGAVAGLGLAYVPEDLAEPYIKAQHLIPVLTDWCPSWGGFYLYYPSRRQPSGAMALLVSALRHAH